MGPILPLTSGETGPERVIDFTDVTQTCSPAVQEAGESPAQVSRGLASPRGFRPKLDGLNAGILSSPAEPSCGPGASHERHSVFPPQKGT